MILDQPKGLKSFFIGSVMEILYFLKHRTTGSYKNHLLQKINRFESDKKAFFKQLKTTQK